MSLLRNPWFTAVLAVGAVALVGYQVTQFRRQPGTEQNTAPATAAAESNPPGVASPPQPKPADPAPANIERAYVESRFDGWVGAPARDPFQLKGPAPVGPSEADLDANSPLRQWHLKAIWQQTGGRLAVINHGIYREGDQIEGYKILKIASDEVWFQGPIRKERLGFDKSGSGNAAPSPGNPRPHP